MIRVITFFWGAVVVFGAIGCGSGPNSWRDFWYRGPTQEQQRRAQRFDPYPKDDLGPAVTGARPREYDRPFVAPQQDYFDRTEPGWSIYGRQQR